MNENIDLTKILKDCPKGTKLYSTVHGEVEYMGINDKGVLYRIKFKTRDGDIYGVAPDGRYLRCFNGESILFPSKEQRDWSKFKVKKPKFDPKTLNPFDKILVKRGYNKSYRWVADFVTASPVTDSDIKYCTMSSVNADMVIPYNEETKHLVGTTEEAPKFYRYWED